MPVNARRDISAPGVSGNPKRRGRHWEEAYMRRSITDIPRLIFNNESRIPSDTKISREPFAPAPLSSAAKNAVGSMIASTLSRGRRHIVNQEVVTSATMKGGDLPSHQERGVKGGVVRV